MVGRAVGDRDGAFVGAFVGLVEGVPGAHVGFMVGLTSSLHRLLPALLELLMYPPRHSPHVFGVVVQGVLCKEEHLADVALLQSTVLMKEASTVTAALVLSRSPPPVLSRSPNT
jgi:hypothetical protein